MSVFLATAVFILMLAAPFLVMFAVIAAVAYGVIALARGIVLGQTASAAVGAFVLMIAVVSGFTLLHWTATKPAEGETSSPHALVYQAWQQTRLRFKALQWMSDGTFERLAREQRERRADRDPRILKLGQPPSGDPLSR